MIDWTSGEHLHSVVYKRVYVYDLICLNRGNETMAVSEKMIRKQFLISPSTAKRLKKIAARQGTSASEIVRQAIDSFDARSASAMDSTELTDLVSARLKIAIKETRKANRVMNKTLRALSEGVA